HLQRPLVARHRLADKARTVFLDRIGDRPILDRTPGHQRVSARTAEPRRPTRVILKAFRPWSWASASSAAIASCGEAPAESAVSAACARQGLWATAPSATRPPATATLASPAENDARSRTLR